MIKKIEALAQQRELTELSVFIVPELKYGF
jgi:hypothetical protein